MISEELKEQLIKHHEEEVKDYDLYCELRDELRKEGCYHEAGMIHDIAQEELMHARILKEIFDKTSR